MGPHFEDSQDDSVSEMLDKCQTTPKQASSLPKQQQRSLILPDILGHRHDSPTIHKDEANMDIDANLSIERHSSDYDEYSGIKSHRPPGSIRLMETVSIATKDPQTQRDEVDDAVMVSNIKQNLKSSRTHID